MIEVDGLTFSYGGDAPAIKDVSFSIAEGEIFGFLGPSGAGKSTTQKILMRLLKGYQGRVRVLGRALQDWREDYFEQIGVCFEFPSNYRKFTALENLKFFASFYAGPTESPHALLATLGLADAADKRVEKFSKGMQIRLNLARALISRPALLFLDEPTAGLDPGNARQIRRLIRDQKDRGATVFLTTHDMTVADDLCDRVGFLVDGKLVLVDEPYALKQKSARRTLSVRHTVDGESRAAEFSLDGLAENAGFQALLRDARLETVHSQEPTLEEVFLQVTGKALA